MNFQQMMTGAGPFLAMLLGFLTAGGGGNGLPTTASQSSPFAQVAGVLTPGAAAASVAGTPSACADGSCSDPNCQTGECRLKRALAALDGVCPNGQCDLVNCNSPACQQAKQAAFEALALQNCANGQCTSLASCNSPECEAKKRDVILALQTLKQKGCSTGQCPGVWNCNTPGCLAAQRLLTELGIRPPGADANFAIAGGQGTCPGGCPAGTCNGNCPAAQQQLQIAGGIPGTCPGGCPNGQCNGNCPGSSFAAFGYALNPESTLPGGA